MENAKCVEIISRFRTCYTPDPHYQYFNVCTQRNKTRHGRAYQLLLDIIIFIRIVNHSACLSKLLPSANVVCEGYVFTPVCDSVNRGGGMCGCPGACMVAPGGGMRGCSGGACVVARGGGMHGIQQDTEKRSMSGRYASYWNAYLFFH